MATDGSQQWSEPGIGPSWQKAFFHRLIRVGGRARGVHMAWIVAAWYVLFYPSVRNRCRPFLIHRFPNRGALGRLWDTYRLVATYGTTLVDMMLPEILGPEALTAESPDRRRLLQLCEKSGFVLLHAHVGCWQIGMSTLAHLTRKLSVVMIPEDQTARLVAEGASIIDPRSGLDGVLRMTQALLSGEIVAMMGDRVFGNDRNTVEVNFLGGKVNFPVAPYRLASATGVPVIAMIAPKIARYRYAIQIGTVIEVPANLGTNSSSYAPYAQQFADCIERFVREHPWQFHNFYDLWTALAAER